MAMLRSKCPQCGEDAKLKYETPFGKKIMRVLKCGHTYWTDEDSPELQKKVDDYISFLEREFETVELDRFDDDGNVLDYSSLDDSFFSLDRSKCARPYQITGVDFIEKTNFRCLIADEMGLGKTIQAEIALKRNPQMLPALFIVKGATVLQWCFEHKEWVDNDPIGIMPIINRGCIIKGFKFYVISMDFISRKGVLEKLMKLGIRCLVLDECQGYKNDGSDRTAALHKLITEGEIEHFIALSGTPFKNRAPEYFNILNLLDPARFYTRIGFCREFCEPNDKGIYTRISPYAYDRFKRITSKYILRREKRDVLKDLPPLRREYTLVEITDPDVKDLYNSELDLFANYRRTAGKLNSTQILGWLARMRSIAGQAKVPWALEYMQEVMDNTEESLAIGIHHQSVRDTLYLAAQAMGYDPLKLSGEDDVFQKNRVQKHFNDGDNRLLIINMIAGGVGLNLQKACHHALVLERMWNSADEEQFEGRFDRMGQEFPVEMNYAVAAGTIDEWFHEMIVEKKKTFKHAMGDKMEYSITDDEEFLNTLMERTLANRLK